MTVRELREQLLTLGPDLPVYIYSEEGYEEPHIYIQPNDDCGDVIIK